MTWQSIDSAPKDGKLFLGHSVRGVEFWHWQTHDGYRVEGWRDSFIYVFSEGNPDGPTHWWSFDGQPMPPPPDFFAETAKNAPEQEQ